MNRIVAAQQFRRAVMSILTVATALPFSGVFAQVAPTAYGKVPNARQIEWYHREMQMFVHFGMNTFTNLEWGTGSESPNSFAPTALDCGQWCRTAKNAGFKSMILVAKHHDGFCIWPSAQTTHDVASSSWRNGAGDVVKEFTDSCAKYGLKAGIYLSCGDFHHDGTVPNYEQFYLDQTKELIKNYGVIREMWWDGANNAMTASSFYRITDSIHAIQPLCAIWSDAAGRNRTAEMRWNGNETATNGDPCWATMDSAWSNANTGILTGPCYVPAEGDISIRDGWFWHSTGTLKTLAALINAYCYSVGRNGGLLMNVPPDTRGRMVSGDSIRVDSLGMWVYGTFDTNLAAGATVTSLHPRGTGFEPANLVDGQESTCYAALDANRTDTITFNLGSSKTFDAIMVQEVNTLGQRTTGWAIQYSTNGTTWNPVTGATGKQSIGYKWIIRITTAVTASYVRLCITAGNACPALHTFGLYRQGYVHQPTTAAAPPSSTRPPRGQGFTVYLAGQPIVLPASFAGKTVSVALLDLKGRVVRQMTAKAGAGASLSDALVLDNGVYVARVRCGAAGKTSVQPFVAFRR